MILIFLISSLWAGEPQASVWTRSPAVARKLFKDSKYYIYDSDTQAKEFAEQGYIMPRERDALFARLKLEAAVRGFDELDKDILVMDAGSSTLEKMRKYYPMLKESQLIDLRRAVQELAKK